MLNKTVVFIIKVTYKLLVEYAQLWLLKEYILIVPVMPTPVLRMRHKQFLDFYTCSSVPKMSHIKRMWTTKYIVTYNNVTLFYSLVSKVCINVLSPDKYATK